MAEPPEYAYQTLPGKRSFRILSIFPGHSQELIQCRIVVASLAAKEPPNYEALSYVWGSSEKACTIQCDGRTLQITQNLHEALMRLRNHSVTKHLWVDAVCINQRDNNERTSQVLMMGDIYSHAQKVLVWLGNATPDVPQALKLIDRIVEICFQHHATSADQDLDNLDDLKHLSGDVSETLLPAIDAPVWTALGNFYSRQWFSRVWVVQEVMKARKAIAICGEFEIDWPRVVIPALWMRRERHLKPKALSICGWEPFLNASVMGDKSLLRSSTPIDLLRMFATFAATDPRDKVYALVGLTPFQDYLPVVPDYNASLSEAYAQVIDLSVKSTGGLDVLSWVRHGRTLPNDFPSWITRWDRNGINFTSAIGHMFFNASQGFRVQDFVIKNSCTLESRGLVFDRISRVLPIMESKWLFNSHLSPDLSKAFRSCLSSPARALYPTGENLFTVFGCVLTAGLRGEVNRVWGDDDAVQHTLSFISWLRDALDPGVSFDMISCDSIGPGQGDKALFEALAGPMRDDRRLFYTEKGYIGIGPSALQIGDEIAVIYGGRVPYVLRQHSRGHQFVGECYVHGIMDGEALRGHEDLALVLNLV